MNYQHMIAAGLCSLVLLSGFAEAAPKVPAANKAAAAKPAPKAPAIKLRKAGDRGAEVLVELTPDGTKLEAEYTAMGNALREELKLAMPAVNDAKWTALIGLLKAELGSMQDACGKPASRWSSS